MNGNDTERRASALAEIQRMHETMQQAAEEIGQLKADLNREHDRVDMMVEERNRYRHEAARFRSLLIELSTQLSNIGLLTRKAEEVMQTVEEVDATPAEEIPPAQSPEPGSTLAMLQSIGGAKPQ